jgi:hypothetical protein
VLNNPIVLNDPTGRAPGEKMDILRDTISLSIHDLFGIEVEFSAQASASTPGISANAQIKSTARVDRDGTVGSDNNASAGVDVNGSRIVGVNANANYTTPPGSPTQVDNGVQVQKPSDAKSQVSMDQVHSMDKKVPIFTQSTGWNIQVYSAPDSPLTSLLGGKMLVQLIQWSMTAGAAVANIPPEDPHNPAAVPMRDPNRDKFD